MIAEIFKTIIYLGSFVIVIFLAFFFTKYMAKKSSSLNGNKSIRIIEAISLGNNTKILIVEIFEIIYIIYDNNSHVLLLDKLSKKEIDQQFLDSIIKKDEINSIVDKLLIRKGNIIGKLSNRSRD